MFYVMTAAFEKPGEAWLARIRWNGVVQINTLIATMISRITTTALGSPAIMRTGADVRWITTSSNDDLRTTLPRLGAGESSFATGTVTDFRTG